MPDLKGGIYEDVDFNCTSGNSSCLRRMWAESQDDELLDAGDTQKILHDLLVVMMWKGILTRPE